MTASIAMILSTFTAPEHIATDMKSTLWLLPLAAAIAVIYKATKVRRIETLPFARECAILFGTIVIIMIIAAASLLGLAWLIIE